MIFVKGTKSEVIHYPTLKTVLMVEEVLKTANEPLKREQIKERLQTKVMHQTLNVILEYLEESGKILDGRKGVLWIFNPSKKLERETNEGIQV